MGWMPGACELNILNVMGATKSRTAAMATTVLSFIAVTSVNPDPSGWRDLTISVDQNGWVCCLFLILLF